MLKARGESKQKGGVAIEFALLFPFVFILFYAGLSYSIYLLFESSLDDFLIQSLRDSVSVYTSPSITTELLQLRVSEVMDAHVDRTWLVNFNLSGCLPSGGWYSVDRDLGVLETCARVDYPLPDLHLFGVSIPGVGSEVRVARVIKL